MAALLRAGHAVAIPFGVARYDLIFEDIDGFHRVQVKTGRVVKGTVRFNTASQEHGGKRRYYSTNEIDYFAVACESLVYLVPVWDVASEGCLRIEPTKSGQVANIRWAKDYLLE